MLLLLIAVVTVFLGFLLLERLRLELSLRKLPVRIVVTGIRGKSTVTRLIAAGLRASGKRVLAKTTGSKPVYILPDGSEEEINRSGPPTIREQKSTISLAARLKVDAVVVEAMSIWPENLLVETGMMIKPHFTVITNVRLDHLDEMGRTRDRISESLSMAITQGATIFLPEAELRPAFIKKIEKRQCRLVNVKADDDMTTLANNQISGSEFPENLSLAMAVLDRLGVSRDMAAVGFKKAVPDYGSLKAWKVQTSSSPGSVLFISAFAANDPESSSKVLNKVKVFLPGLESNFFGFLCLREDRGSRTEQWLEAIGENFFRDFNRVFILGWQAGAVRRKLIRRKVENPDKYMFFKKARPEEIIDLVNSFSCSNPVVVGLGNIVGTGETFIEFMENRGSRYDL